MIVTTIIEHNILGQIGIFYYKIKLCDKLDMCDGF